MFIWAEITTIARKQDLSPDGAPNPTKAISLSEPNWDPNKNGLPLLQVPKQKSTLVNSIPSDSFWYSELNLKDAFFCILVDQDS